MVQAERPADDLTGTVFDIQRYSIHDGPGIRTLVFLKGCPLRCLWCCNPESQGGGPELQFFSSRCARCGACLRACPEGAIDPTLPPDGLRRIDRAKCTDCGLCVPACPNGALALAGQQMSVSTVVEAVKRDARFYRRSHGGVTLSGGEPLTQGAFARAVLQRCYEEGIHTAIETCGAFAWEEMSRVIPYLDLVLFDLKHVDPARHRELTGASNAAIHANLRRLAGTGVPIVVRVPLIPGLNTDAANLRGLAGLAKEVGALEVHLMPFHQLGKDKYRRLGRPYALADVPDLLGTAEGRGQVDEARSIFASAGLEVHVGG